MTSNLTTTPRGIPSEMVAPTSVIASARGLVKTYGTGDMVVQALAGIDVDFVRGELTAIMGPSGSGKSTLMHCMAGLDTVTSGTVMVDGQDVGRMNQRQLTRLRRTRLGFIFQAFNLVPTLTAAENITLPLDIARRPIDRAHLDAIVAAVGLEKRLHHRPGELSGGQPGIITIESVLTAVFGTVVGVAVGVTVAAAMPTVFNGTGLTTLAIPWAQLVAMLVLAVVVGVLAALWPASRAARLPVLDAVASD